MSGRGSKHIWVLGFSYAETGIFSVACCRRRLASLERVNLNTRPDARRNPHHFDTYPPPIEGERGYLTGPLHVCYETFHE